MTLEPDPAAEPPVVLSPYDSWKASGNPDDLAKVVDGLGGKIATHLHRYGLGSDPMANSQARVYAAKAVKSYNPESGASMETWLDRNMQQLSRFKRQRATAVKVPERIQLDSYTINKARVAFEEENGRDPDLDELADASGMTVKRLNDVTKSFRKMSGEEPFEGNLAGSEMPDYAREALEVTWEEAGTLDRKIIEMKTGYGGKYPSMSANEVAARLNLSPVELSRRSARLASKIDELWEALEEP